MRTWSEHLTEMDRLYAENAQLRRRIRLMLKCVRTDDHTLDLGTGRNWYISDLANLRRPLPRARKAKR